MMKSLISVDDIPELLELLNNNEVCKGNITKTTKLFCKLKNIFYDDSMRRRVSFLLSQTREPSVKKDNKKSPAKVLVLDIETSYLETRGFSLYPSHIPYSDIRNDWFILTVSAKWLFDENVISYKLTSEELATKDDSRVVKQVWQLLDEADIVIAHNGYKFDIRKLNARFLKHDYKLPSPFKIIDTLRHSKQIFALTSNALDYICIFLGIEGKIENEKGLWHKVMDGDMEALERMSIYNDKDVTILEEVYLRLRPYMRSHPNIGLYITEDVCTCPNCGSEDLSVGVGSDYITSVNRFETFRCMGCGATGRNRKPIKLERENLTTTIAGL